MKKDRSQSTPAEAVKNFRLDVQGMFGLNDGVERDFVIMDNPPHGDDWGKVEEVLRRAAQFETAAAAYPPESGAEMSLFLETVRGLIAWLALRLQPYTAGRPKDDKWQEMHEFAKRVKPILLRTMNWRDANRAIEDMLRGQCYGAKDLNGRVVSEIYPYRDKLDDMSKDAKKKLFQLDK